MITSHFGFCPAHVEPQASRDQNWDGDNRVWAGGNGHRPNQAELKYFRENKPHTQIRETDVYLALRKNHTLAKVEPRFNPGRKAQPQAICLIC